MSLDQYNFFCTELWFNKVIRILKMVLKREKNLNFYTRKQSITKPLLQCITVPVDISMRSFSVCPVGMRASSSKGSSISASVLLISACLFCWRFWIQQMTTITRMHMMNMGTAIPAATPTMVLISPVPSFFAEPEGKRKRFSVLTKLRS